MNHSQQKSLEKALSHAVQSFVSNADRFLRAPDGTGVSRKYMYRVLHWQRKKSRLKKALNQT